MSAPNDMSGAEVPVSNRPRLRALAEGYGILSGYEGADGHWCETADATREALLSAMGVDASSEELAERALLLLPAAQVEPENGEGEPSCWSVSEVLGDRRAFGLAANLYTVRSADNWGIGDLSDLCRLIEWAGAASAAFIGINPIQAMNCRGDANPYYPSSRYYRDPIYLDVTAVPEFAACGEARQLLASPQWQADLQRQREAANLQWRQLAECKDVVLQMLYRSFASARQDGTQRWGDFEAFRLREGKGLRDFATYCALAEHLDGESDWRRWPSQLQRSDSEAVQAFRREHVDGVEYHVYLQFELDRQLASAAAAADAAGMSIGIFGDLPVGCAPGGSDTWSNPDLFAAGVSIGAPPDTYSSSGQDWGLAVLRPGVLATERGEEYWRRLLRQAMRHCGALRLDHAMGVVRQFWIPAGETPAAGAYVVYPSSRLMRTMAEISRAHRCIVIAEDLGTVPSDFRARLKRWGILRNQILYFEQSSDRFLGSTAYVADALVAANSHDLPPLEGYWRGDDLTLREGAGHLGAAEVAQARTERERARTALASLLRDEDIVAPDWWPSKPGMLASAVHSFLASTPSRLFAVSLDDLAGERVPVNVPGASAAVLPSWRRRMAMPLEDVGGSTTARETLARVAMARR